jgi:hypothetical protein
LRAHLGGRPQSFSVDYDTAKQTGLLETAKIPSRRTGRDQELAAPLAGKLTQSLCARQGLKKMLRVEKSFVKTKASSKNSR